MKYLYPAILYFLTACSVVAASSYFTLNYGDEYTCEADIPTNDKWVSSLLNGINYIPESHGYRVWKSTNLKGENIEKVYARNLKEHEFLIKTKDGYFLVNTQMKDICDKSLNVGVVSLYLSPSKRYILGVYFTPKASLFEVSLSNAVKQGESWDIQFEDSIVTWSINR